MNEIKTNTESSETTMLLILQDIEDFEDGKKKIENIKRYLKKDCLCHIGIILYTVNKNCDFSKIVYTEYKQNNIKIFNIGYIGNAHINSALKDCNFTFCNDDIWVVMSNPNVLKNLSNPGLLSTLENNKQEGNVIFDDVEYSLFNVFIEQPRKTIGCYMIVKNEEKRITKCIENLEKFCDEIVVVDTGSTDNTVPKAKCHYIVDVHHFYWVNDFSAARNYALSKTKSDYVFSIDADELFTDELIDKIRYLKQINFSGYTTFEMYLQLSEDDWYLGGRQIVKNDGSNLWKYRIHEKLYHNENNLCILNGDGEWIIHTPDDPFGNWDSYQEIYYNDINHEKIFTLIEYNTGHYFYYLFFTLKDCDEILSKKYLYKCFDKNNVTSGFEKIQISLLKDGCIDQDEFNIYSLINLYNDPNMVLEYVDTICHNELPKYQALLWCYENGGELSEQQTLDLSCLFYKYGMFNDFVKLTYEQKEKFPFSKSVIHNINFIEEDLSKIKDYEFVIDCTEDPKYVASTIYYISQYTDKITYMVKDGVNAKHISLLPYKGIKIEMVKSIDEISTANKLMIFNAKFKYNRFEIQDFMVQLINDMTVYNEKIKIM